MSGEKHCPICKAPMVQKDGHQVCSEFDSYKRQLRDRSLDEMVFMAPQPKAPVPKKA